MFHGMGLNLWQGGWVMWLMMVLFWVGLAALIVAVIRALSGPARSESESRRALDIVKRRYARGEISAEEYLEALDYLDLYGEQEKSKRG